MFRGDAEAGLAVTLADRWDPRDAGAACAPPRRAWCGSPPASGAGSTARWRSGPGDGQTDIELRGVVDLGSGNVGVRLEGGYNRQLAGDVRRAGRAAEPAVPAADLLAPVRLDPGDVATFAVRPFFRLARTFALIGSVEHWSKGEDAAEFDETGADPRRGPRRARAGAPMPARRSISIGVTYSNPGALRPGGTGLPVDAGWTYERVVSASGGIVPDVHRLRARLRLYFGVW